MKLYRLIENGDFYTEQEKNECIKESEGLYSERDFIENEYWETNEDPADRDDRLYHEEQDHIAMEKAKENK